MHTCNPDSWKVEAGGQGSSRVQDQPGLHETLSPNKQINAPKSQIENYHITQQLHYWMWTQKN